MRIAIIICSHPESTIALAKNLAKEGVVVDYYCTTWWWSKTTSAFDYKKAPRRLGLIRLQKSDAPEVFKYLGDCNVSVNLIRWIPFFRKLRYIVYPINCLITRLVAWQIKKVNYDLVNFVGQFEFLVYLHKLFSHFKRVHNLHEVAKFYDGQDLNSALFDYLFSEKIPIVVHSQISFDRIIQYKKCKKELVSIIPFGPFESYLFFDSSRADIIPEENDFVLCYGFIEKYKGLDILNSAIKLLDGKIRGLRVVIAGRGYVPELEDLKKNSNCIVINRILTNEELISLNKRARVIVCPYRSGSQTGITMTTFLFARPIIASDIEAFKDIIIDGINGLIFKNGSAEELANSILRIYEDKKLYENLLAGVKRFSENSRYNWSYIAKATIDLYQKVITEKTS